MLKKKYTKSGVKVTFEVDYLPEAEQVELLGDFNDWTPQPLKKFKNGKHKLTVDLEPNSRYHFRYLVDGEWENEWEADGYERNGYGEENSLLEV